MADETKKVNQKGGNSNSEGSQGDQNQNPTLGSVILIVVVILYLTLLSILLVYALVQIWPYEKTVTQGNTPTAPPVVKYLFWTFSVSDEIRIILIVAITGALGGLVHCMRSAFDYAGHKMLMWRWFPMYILLPFIGSILGLIFYLVIRGGFFSPESTIDQTSPYGFAALSALVGMFSQQAVLKLKDVFETLLTKVKRGKDPIPQGNDSNSNVTGNNS